MRPFLIVSIHSLMEIRDNLLNGSFRVMNAFASPDLSITEAVHELVGCAA